NRQLRIARSLDPVDLQATELRDPGSPGEIVGTLNVHLFGDGFGLLYYFPDSPLCDKSGQLPWRPVQTKDKFIDLTCDNPSAKGHLIAISRVHRYFLAVTEKDGISEFGRHRDILSEAAAVAGFWERRTLTQRPRP